MFDKTRKEIKKALNHIDKQPFVKSVEKHGKSVGKTFSSLGKGLDFGKGKKIKKSYKSEGLRF